MPQTHAGATDGATDVRRRGLRPGGAPSGAETDAAKGVLARLDRLDVWSMPLLFVGIIGIGFLFTFYDVFDINVSFIQSCVALKPGCTPATALNTIRIPIALNLAGYVAGTLLLSPISDKIGRRNMLLVTMVLTGIGSLWNALAPDYTNFVLARVLTGMAVGADLSIVNTYIGEVAPRRNRAKWTSVIFVNSALGALLGIWLGLFLTTEKTPWPHGLPFAQASPTFTDGWRWMYGIGALLALIAVVLRVELPESPRWLIGQGRVDEADHVVSEMEKRASRRGELPPVPDDVSPEMPSPGGYVSFKHVLGNATYLKRVAVLVMVWFFAYVTVFAFSAGGTSLLTALHYPPPEAGIIQAVGAFGFLACALFAVRYAERLERKLWLPIGALITVVGSILVAEAGTSAGIAFVGMAIVFFGFNVWVPMTYALSAESFPTRARVTGFGLVDGIGHLGGGIGVLLIAPQIPHMSVLGAFLVISGFLVVAAVIAQFAIDTRARRFEDVSP
ncbi:MAG TPA: MFS transporter [Solirubrobacteraceae bacterium]|nr:MFS transporter [Solirubrobacteraceae bacterium]